MDDGVQLLYTTPGVRRARRGKRKRAGPRPARQGSPLTAELRGVDPREEERVREVFARVPLPRLLGMRMEALGRGVCRLSVPMKEDLRQRYGVMHGGVIAALVDTAAAYAIYPQVAPDREITTVEMKVSFLASIRNGDTALAEARLLRLGRTLAVCTCDVRDGSGRPAAAALVTYMVIPGATTRAAGRSG